MRKEEHMNSINFVLSVSDHKKTSRILTRLRKRARKNDLRSTFFRRRKDDFIGIAVLLFIFGPMLYIIFQNDWFQNLKTAYATFALFLLVYIGRYYYDYLNFDQMAKELIRLYPETTVYLVESGIVFENQYSATNLKYESIREIKELKEYVFIFFDDNHAYFIPCRAFPSGAEKKDFLSEVDDRSRRV